MQAGRKRFRVPVGKQAVNLGLTRQDSERQRRRRATVHWSRKEQHTTSRLNNNNGGPLRRGARGAGEAGLEEAKRD